MSAVLVTGGAGYIGSHATLHLLNSGHKVVVLDNLYSGFSWAVDPRAKFVEGNIADQSLVARVIEEHDLDVVMHFAGHIVVPESVENPLKYYQNNVSGSISLLQACQSAGIKRFIFSSSAAVYGMPKEIPIIESANTAPISPYGITKLMTELTLEDLAKSDDSFHFVALRYFNVAGAHVNGGLGQSTPEATHLIKIASQAAVGMRQGMAIFGTDYDTPDGTCIRDYIHVDDLAAAHVNAVEFLAQNEESLIVNCGYGKGYSVKQVIEKVKLVSGVDFPVAIKARRPGDPAALVADCQKARDKLGWKAVHDDLEEICRSAVLWEKELQSKRKQS